MSPAQAQVQLTSTGYVVPQIEVDVSSKLVGRVDKANVREGCRGQGGADPVRARRERPAGRGGQRPGTGGGGAGARGDGARAARGDRRSSAIARSASPTPARSRQATADDLDRACQVPRGAGPRRRRRRVGLAGRGERARDEPRATRPSARPSTGPSSPSRCSPGDVVSPGTPMAKIADFSSIVVETDVPEGRLHLVTKGRPCEIVLDAYPDRRWRGEVVEVQPAAQSRQGDGHGEGAVPRPRRHRAAGDGGARVVPRGAARRGEAEGAAQARRPRLGAWPSAGGRRWCSSLEQGKRAHGAGDAGQALRRRVRARRRAGARARSS